MESAVQIAAVVYQPWSTVPPSPSDPLGVSVDKTARAVAPRCMVVCYASRLSGQEAVQPLLGLQQGQGEIRRVSARLDRVLMPLKILDRLGLSKGHRPFNSTSLYQLGYMLKIAQSLRADPCDVVHIHQFPQWASILRRLNPNLAIVLHMHDNWLTRLDRDRTRQRLRDVDLVIGVSEFVAQRIRDAFPEFAGMVHHAYVGVDDLFFTVQKKEEPRPQEGSQLVYASPITTDKGARVLIDAFERIYEKKPAARLSLIGDEAEPGLLNQLRAGLTPGAREAVSFKGELTGPALADQFAQADLAIAPTLSEEPSGVHLLRAMAAGVTPIASKTGAFPELIEPGKTGQLVTPGDAGDLAAAILDLLNDPTRCRAMGQAAKAFTEQHFRWPVAADALLGLYGQAAEHRRQSARLREPGNRGVGAGSK